MVRAKDCDQVRLGVVDKIEILKNRVRRALVPQLAHPHLRRHRDDEVIGQHPAELPSILKMLDQRLRSPLHEHVDCVDARVDEIGENEIDDAVFAAERHRRLGAIPGQGMKPGPLPSGHYKRQRSHWDKLPRIVISPASLSRSARQVYMSRATIESYSSKSQSAAFFVRETPELWQRAQEFPGNENSQSYQAGECGEI